MGGLTGLVKKPGSSNNFDTFYHKGTLKVQQAPGAAGYLFGDMVKDGRPTITGRRPRPAS